MTTAFLICLIVGAVVLGFQIVLGMFGFDPDADLDSPDADVGGSDAATGLQLLSVRSVAAALLTFGAVALVLDRFLFSPVAAVLAVPPAFGAAVFTAWLMRQVLRLESDGSIRLSNAVGSTATVYMAIPPLHAALPAPAGEVAGAGPSSASARGDAWGMVHVNVQGRTIEVRAITRDAAAPLPVGSSVVIVAADGDTVEVVPAPLIEEVQ